jgi:hypothetical protein
MATNYESQKGFYENVKLDENGYLLVTGISGGGGATGPAGTSGSSGSSGVNGSDGTSGVNGSGGSSGTSGVSPEGGAAGLVAGVGALSIQSNTTLTPGATAVAFNSIAIGSTVSTYGELSVSIGTNINDNVGRDQTSNNSDYNVAIGSNITVNPLVNKGVYIGRDIINGIYPNEIYEGDGCVLIGKNIYARGGGQIVIGRDAVNGAQDRGVNRLAVVIGQEARAEGFGGAAVVIGPLCNLKANTGILIGFNGESIDTDAGSILAIGIGVRAKHTSTALGNFSVADSLNSVAVGQSSTTTANNSIAIGVDTAASHDGAAVLGKGLTSSVANHTHVNSLFIKEVPVYADNAAALTGGLIAGQVYRTSTGVLMITY